VLVKKFLTLLFLSGIVSVFWAQTGSEDSRYSTSQHILAYNHNQEIEEVDRMILEASKLPPEEAEKLLDKALTKAWKIPYLYGLGAIYNAKGLIERKKNRFVQSVQYHKRALNFLENSPNTLLRIANLNNLAVSLRKLNLESEAMKYYMEALQLAQQTGDIKNKAIVYHGIGNVYTNLEEYEKANKFFFKALKYEKERHNTMGMEFNYANLAESYTFLKKFDTAKLYLDSMMTIAQNLYGKNLGIEYNLFAKYYFYRGDYRKAAEYYNKSVELVREKNILRYVSNGLIMWGKSLLHLNRNEEAIRKIKEGLDIALKIRSKENIALGYDALTDYFASINRYKEALNYQKTKEKYKDSIINVRSKQIINALEILHETHEKDNKIKQLALEKALAKQRLKRNYILFGIGSIISLAIIFLLLVIVKQKKEKSDLILEQKNKEIQYYIEQLNLIKGNNSGKKSKVSKKNGKKTEGVSLNEKFCNDLSKIYSLTKREGEILQYICQGKTNEDIAEELFISKNTVKSHIRHLYEKLDVKNRHDVIRKIQQGAL